MGIGMLPEDEIKRFGIKCGAAITGIAAVKEINKYAPLGHKPDDFLTGATSVIVVANRWTPLGVWRSPKHTVHPSNRSFGGVSPQYHCPKCSRIH